MTADKNRFTTTCIAKSTLEKLHNLARKLKFPSVQTLLESLAVAVEKANFNRFDIDCLIQFGKIPDIISNDGTRLERDFFIKLGLTGEKARKIGGLENIETESMPTSEQFFTKKEGETKQ